MALIRYNDPGELANSTDLTSAVLIMTDNEPFSLGATSKLSLFRRRTSKR